MGKKDEHLRIEERTMIQLGLEQCCTLRAIARSVQRSPSTVTGTGAQWLDLPGSQADQAWASASGGRLSGYRR